MAGHDPRARHGQGRDPAGRNFRPTAGFVTFEGTLRVDRSAPDGGADHLIVSGDLYSRLPVIGPIPPVPPPVPVGDADEDEAAAGSGIDDEPGRCAERASMSPLDPAADPQAEDPDFSAARAITPISR